MIDGALVIDAVAHGYDVSPANRADECPPEYYQAFGSFMHKLGHCPLESKEPGYMLTEDEFVCRWTAEALASAFFLESAVDLVFYHHVPYAGFFQDGVSRLDTGFALRELAPERVFVYGGVDTFVEDRGLVFAQMEELVDRGVVGFKFYPSDGRMDATGRALRQMTYDNPEAAYPFFEKARELGITRLAFHKAFPMGPAIDPVRVSDMTAAAVAFPDLTFEIVHAGWAFLEETALELLIAPNIYANLEVSANVIVRQPRKFATMLGQLLLLGGHERLLFGTGCALTHPAPVLNAFWNFEMPEDLRQGFDYPDVTREMKEAMLAGNMARLHGLDIEKKKEIVATDEWTEQRERDGTHAPWSVRRAEARAGRQPVAAR